MIILECNCIIQYLDPICDIATVIIAIANIFLVFYVFRKDSQRDILKSLVLDYNIKYLYDFYEGVLQQTTKLKKLEITENLKKEIEKEIQTQGVILEQKFIDLFLVIDKDLHDNLRDKIDYLTGELSKALFDDGINLNVQTKYDEKIANVVSLSKSEILNLLLNKCINPKGKSQKKCYQIRRCKSNKA